MYWSVRGVNGGESGDRVRSLSLVWGVVENTESVCGVWYVCDSKPLI